MDKEFDNTNRAAVWRNDKKTTDKHPDLTGSINVEGVDYWLSGWVKGPDASAKAPAIKFAITKKEQQVQQRPQSPPQESYAEEGPKPMSEFVDDLSNIPF